MTVAPMDLRNLTQQTVIPANPDGSTATVRCSGSNLAAIWQYPWLGGQGAEDPENVKKIVAT